jgi:hypothetical protein
MGEIKENRRQGKQFFLTPLVSRAPTTVDLSTLLANNAAKLILGNPLVLLDVMLFHREHCSNLLQCGHYFALL